MDDVIRIDDKWYVLASSSRADDQRRVLKDQESFALFDRFGDIHHLGVGEQGLYHQSTRFLSHWQLTVNQRRPLLLNSAVSRDNTVLVVDLTTPDLYRDGRLFLAKGTVHLFRAVFLHGATCHQHLRLHNYGSRPVTLEVEVQYGADFNDIFQVRGVCRARHGGLLPARVAAEGVTLAYQGLDGVQRSTRIGFSPAPDQVTPEKALFRPQLPPGDSLDIFITVTCCSGEPATIDTPLPYNEALAAVRRRQQRLAAGQAAVFTSNEQFNDWLERSAADLRLLTTDTDDGPYPFAGVPWFSTPFGRDGIITALQTLWLDPRLARGVLFFLARHQARDLDPANDAEPGKILHELRHGEMAALGEIPFARYYGTVDATPLFVFLAGAYYQRTGDLAAIRRLWPHIQAALAWIETHGDVDGDGFVEYHRKSANGIIHQGWKDSNDSVFHADGTPAAGPIALVEVQGYVFAAYCAAAMLALRLGRQQEAAALRRRAARLRQRFNEVFWDAELETFVLALDGDKRPCRVRTSNAGHALFTGIAHRRLAPLCARTLMAEPSFSGWGIRTVAAGEPRYNPMSYHNGSVWPHDNSLIGAGFARYRLTDQLLALVTGLFNGSIFVDLHRLPELFCGFPRRPHQGPTLYPVACAPQAWAAGTPFLLLQACLGMEFSVQRPQLIFRHPVLPDYIDFLRITNLRVGPGLVDLELRRRPHDVGITVSRKEGDVEVAVLV